MAMNRRSDLHGPLTPKARSLSPDAMKRALVTTNINQALVIPRFSSPLIRLERWCWRPLMLHNESGCRRSDAMAPTGEDAVRGT